MKPGKFQKRKDNHIIHRNKSVSKKENWFQNCSETLHFQNILKTNGHLKLSMTAHGCVMLHFVVHRLAAVVQINPCGGK